MNIHSVESASARYQQYVQSMSDIHDLIQTVMSNQMTWVSLMVDTQKSGLDLFKNCFATSAQSDVLPQMMNTSAKYALQAAQGSWPD